MSHLKTLWIFYIRCCVHLIKHIHDWVHRYRVLNESSQFSSYGFLGKVVYFSQFTIILFPRTVFFMTFLVHFKVLAVRTCICFCHFTCIYFWNPPGGVYFKTFCTAFSMSALLFYFWPWKSFENGEQYLDCRVDAETPGSFILAKE